MRDLGQLPLPTLNLVRITRNVVGVIVADPLTRVEQVGDGVREEAVGGVRRNMETWLDDFYGPRGGDAHVGPSDRRDRKPSERMVTMCLRYALLRRRVEDLQAKIDERNRKDPPTRRVKGSGYELWFVLYAAPRRELPAQLSDQLTQIVTALGAAALVLDDLPDEILEVGSKVHRVEAATALDSAIYGRLRYLVKQLDVLDATLAGPTDSPRVTPWTFTVPTSLVYLHPGENPLHDLAGERRPVGGGPPWCRHLPVSEDVLSVLGANSLRSILGGCRWRRQS